jgi:hypothetical protein
VSERDVIAALAEHWPEALPHFGPRDLSLLAGLIAAIEAAGDDAEGARDALADLMTLLAVRLPDEHPVHEAMARETRYAGASPADLSRVAAVLKTLPGLDLVLPKPPTPASGASVAAAAGPYAWLLAAPAVTEQEILDAGGDPGRADLIRLPRADRSVVLPAFQFDPAGRPVPVVTMVNRILDAAADPWGVADWWLGKNAWLQGTPAELVGRVPDSELVLAARAELPEE